VLPTRLEHLAILLHVSEMCPSSKLNRLTSWPTFRKVTYFKGWGTKACIIIARIYATHFPRFAQNLVHTHCSFVAESHQARYWTQNRRTYKISMSTQLCEILHTVSQDMLVPLSTVALRYYNCCTDGNISLGNYGYLAVVLDWLSIRTLILPYATE
jgi:hypothetical protein